MPSVLNVFKVVVLACTLPPEGGTPNDFCATIFSRGNGPKRITSAKLCGKCERAEKIQLCEHGDAVCIVYPPDSGGHMQKRACDERAIIGSRRLKRFFILAAKWGYQQPE
jgi:hypothetical protein